MKIYRKSIWSADTTKSYFIPSIVIILLISLSVPSYLYIYYIIIMFFFTSIIFITRCFYIILTDSELIIQNGICKFWKRKYKYSDITRVTIRYLGGYININMQISTLKRDGMGYTIDLIKYEDYNNLILDLKKNGVKVETKNIDHILNKFSIKSE